MPDTIVIAYGIAAAEYAILTVVLIVAALRNHFRHHLFRPAIFAVALLSAVNAAQNSMRIYSGILRTTGQTADYLAFMNSDWWTWGAIAATVAGAVLFYTLVLAYPSSTYSEPEDAEITD
jgi:hypothetical protein